MSEEYDSSFFFIHGENEIENREEHFESILGQLQFAVTVGLDNTIGALDVLIADIAKGGCKTIDLFTVQHITTLLGYCFPLEKKKKKARLSGEGSGANDSGENFRITSNGKCGLFWKYLTSNGNSQTGIFEDYGLANMTAEELVDNKMLPLLVHSHMNRLAEKMKSVAAIRMIKSLHTDVPKTVHESLEFKTGITADRAKAEAVDALRSHFKTNRGEFEKLGMRKMPKSLRVVAPKVPLHLLELLERSHTH